MPLKCSQHILRTLCVSQLTSMLEQCCARRALSSPGERCYMNNGSVKATCYVNNGSAYEYKTLKVSSTRRCRR